MHLHSSTTPRRVAAVALTATLALAMTGCAKSERGTDGGGASKGKTFVFAASSDPVVLDPSMASDGESFRVARQMFEGLVGTKPGTADPAPLLAESWTPAADGLSYTFKLKKGVKFHDGTPFNAEAVCKNFERWYNWTGVNQSESIGYYYITMFKGFKKNEDPKLKDPVYKSCAAQGEDSATISLNKPFAGFVAAMSLPAFAMQSPTAMEKHGADKTAGDANDPRFSEYGTKYPTGTGPFVFDSWAKGQKVTLKRNDNYWGTKAKIDKVVIQTISDGKARLQALKNNEIDGYDLVAPGDLEGLKSAGYVVEGRKPFNILYMGMNQATPALANIKVRQAIAHAINREAIIKQSMPAGTTPAISFTPDTVAGYTTDVVKYEYNPGKAKQLLAEAGQSNLTLRFNYPTGVSRPYMPTPEDTFVAIKAQLEAVGIKVTPITDKWSPDYLDKVKKPDTHDLHLLGWTGDYNDPDNFLGTFFGEKTNEWGFDNPELFKALDTARGLPTVAQQTPEYVKINKKVMEFLPGIPIAHPVPSLAFNKKVKNYPTSPVQDEVWNEVTIDG